MQHSRDTKCISGCLIRTMATVAACSTPLRLHTETDEISGIQNDEIKLSRVKKRMRETQKKKKIQPTMLPMCNKIKWHSPAVSSTQAHTIDKRRFFSLHLNNFTVCVFFFYLSAMIAL